LPNVRRVLLAAIVVAALASVAELAVSALSTARADSATAALAAKRVSLPDMALGSAKAPITIVEYSSMTCPHCAAFSENVFPMLQSKYIDTGKVRFVSREFPLEIKAVGASMLARCIAGDDAQKFFDAQAMLFKQQQALVDNTTETLAAVGGKFGMSRDAVEACVKDDALLNKITADQDFAFKQLKVDATPTFFVNGEKLRGSMSFEELDKKLSALLKR